jgi:hypothetical protein
MPYLPSETMTKEDEIRSVPLIDLQEKAVISHSAFRDAYDYHQAVHIRGYKPTHRSPSTFHANDVRNLFDSLADEDKESWCIENKANHNHDRDNDECDNIKPQNFLCNNKKGRGYCSFLVQHSKEVLEDLLATRLPMVHLPVKREEESEAAAVEAGSCSHDDDSNSSIMKVDYGPALWLFFGKNYSSAANETILGRPEHTDSVTHDGTFHYQLSGTKIWHLRPTTELIHAMRNSKMQCQSECCPSNKKRKINQDSAASSDNKIRIQVECKEGDILLLNTRLWWHSTTVPCQDVPCISYARDIYFTPQQNNSDSEHHNDQTNNRESSMTNVDGTYAANDIEADTILFTEHNMPDIELPRSKDDPNCRVVELEDNDGETYMAVVSLRAINSGEFFKLEESDDDDSDDDDDDVGGEEAWEEEDGED